MEKDKIYDELAKVNVELNKLREESELSDGLRRAHVDQQAKIHQAKLEIEKLAQELNCKSEEIREIRQACEELQSSLHRKEMFLQQTNCSNEKLQAEHKEKILVLEHGNRDLSVALDEATARIRDLERKTGANDEEIATLKRILSVKSEKDTEMQRNASKDLKETEEYMLKLEEQTRIDKEQLKWKREQFSHLEEAHDKLQTQFQASAVDWKKEKSSLIKEISKLQAGLDDKNQISECLENQLKMCHQALAHEESRRKVLESQLSKSRLQFENAFLDCQEAQTDIEQTAVKRDEEIAEVRCLLRKKDMLANETRHGSVKLEEEKRYLLECFRDAEAAKLDNSCAASSLKKMQDKLQGLDQLHKKYASNLKEKDAEWNHQIEKLKEDLICCLSELGGKNKSIREIQKELEDCRLLLEVKNEEVFALYLVLKSEFCVAFSKMCDENMKLGMCIKQAEEKNMLLKQQLEMRITELNQVHADLKQRCDDTAALTAKFESLNSLKQKKYLVDDELKKYKEMLDESNECQRCLKEQCLRLENTLIENRKNASDDLEMVTSELANKTSELYKSKLELEQWKTEADTLKLKLEEYKLAHKQEMKERNQVIFNLEKEVKDLRNEVECQEKNLIESKQETLDLKGLLQSKKSEMEERIGQFEVERRIFKDVLEELKKASICKEDSLSKLEGICGRFGVFCRDDMKLMDMLETILQSSEDIVGDLLASGGLDDTTFSPSKNRFMQFLMKEFH
ncbi:uncharacterized protein At4g38062-like [Primulina tabacum]|uniref:uncharacterized protein At4g38062-like n=1 Tax=Primulina tabacum TaxID=48773 RepID=UPI003F5A822C